ncbi:hypothetical protein K7864_33845 [Streptomyces sp. SP2-10]|nr:hypothetical protein [Streptomyces sp. SP2-10]MBY8846163.1 hypothetical protein [Streptomyces sp. SP2-10]
MALGRFKPVLGTALRGLRAGEARSSPRPALPSPSSEPGVHTLTAPVHRRVQAVYRLGTGRRPGIRHVLDTLAATAAVATAN